MSRPAAALPIPLRRTLLDPQPRQQPGRAKARLATHHSAAPQQLPPIPDPAP